MSEKNIDRLCRTCMNESHSYSPIYEEILHEDSILFEVINDVCQLEVTMTDELPKYICSDCSFKLSEFKKFKIRSHEVRASLQRLKGNVLNLNWEKPSGSPSIEICESIKVKMEPEDTYEAVSGGMGYETFEEYIGIEPDDLTLNAVKAERHDSVCPDPLEFLDTVEINKEENVCKRTDPAEFAFNDSVEIKKEDSVDWNEGENIPEDRDPLEVSNLLVHATEGAVRSREHTGIKIRISKVANGEKLIEKRKPDIKFRGHRKDNDSQEGTHCVNVVVKLIKQPKSTKEIHFFCDYCQKGFAKKYNLGEHVRVHTGVRPYNCSICDKSFAQKGDLSRHTVSHNNEEPFVCSECGKTFKQKRYMMQHMKIHAEGKKFVCEICGKACATKALLNRHARVHRKDNPFVCNICGKCFNHDDQLKYHLITHNDTMPFCCEICGKGFALQSILRKHQLYHSDERPFPCNICNKSFKTKYELNKHLRLHDGTRPYKCSLCSKNFSLNRNLKRHLKSHLGEKQYPCSNCGVCFSQLSRVKEHLRNDCKGK